MLPVSSAYFEPRICASSLVACKPAHASLRAVLAISGRSLKSAAAPVSPLASAVKNAVATGSGPLGLGVQALSPPMAATTTRTVQRPVTRDAGEVSDAIEADVRSQDSRCRGGAPRSDPAGQRSGRGFLRDQSSSTVAKVPTSVKPIRV